MIVTEEDLDDENKLKDRLCDLCGKSFEVGQSYEEITTQRGSELVIHTECVKKGI